LGSQVSGVVETGVWTADKQPVALLAKKRLDSASNSAASDKGHAGALYSKNSDPAAEVGVVLFTTALGLYGSVLWSGKFQGLIIHELVPIHSTRIGHTWRVLAVE
jgi:hypothetical protein